MKRVLLFFYLIPVNLLPVNRVLQPADSVTGEIFPVSTVDWGGVIFSEVMFDPDPPVKLPEYEYLELLNRSAEPVSLEGWTLGINSRIYEIPGGTFSPGERVVLTSVSGAESFGEIQGVIPVFGSMYALPNDGGILVLYDTTGIPVHAARYEMPWDGPGWKKEGGWSLEAPDVDQVCNISGLWEFSIDPSGGTPGRENSVSLEITGDDAPVLLYCSSWDSGSIRLTFSEPVWSPASETEWIDLQPGGRSVEDMDHSCDYGEPLAVRLDQSDYGRPLPGRLDPGCVLLMPGGIRPDSVVSVDPLGEEVMVYFPPELIPAGEFRLLFSDITDCSGQPLAEREISLGNTDEPGQGSVVVNEVMFDPWEGDPEFIELLVMGTRFSDLLDFSIIVSDSDPVPLSSRSRIVAPGDYLLVVQNVPHLRTRYHLDPSGRWIQVPGLKTLPNSGGYVILTDRAGNTLDMATYHDGMHLEVLGDTKGVSLERIYPDRPGIEAVNWHSAASIEGYSTPGRPNSQSPVPAADPGDGPGTGKELKTEPRVFSPDNDGYLDLLEILVETGTPGYVIRLWITDTKGRRVRSLANNHLAGPEVRYTWDGEGDDGRMSVVGIYVVHLVAYHPGSGNSIVRRVAVGLIYP